MWKRCHQRKSQSANCRAGVLRIGQSCVMGCSSNDCHREYHAVEILVLEQHIYQFWHYTSFHFTACHITIVCVYVCMYVCVCVPNKPYGFCGCQASCLLAVKVEVAVTGSPPLTVLMVSVDVNESTREATPVLLPFVLIYALLPLVRYCSLSLCLS